jgi:hypothetical protein
VLPIVDSSLLVLVLSLYPLSRARVPGLGTSNPLLATSREMVTPQYQSFNRDIFQVFRGMCLKHFSSRVWHASVQNVAVSESFGVHVQVAQRNGEVD